MNLNSGPYDDTHEKIRNNAGYGHHQALNYSDTCIEAQHKEQVMLEAWMESDHEVADSSSEKGNQYQEWHCRECVAEDKGSDTIVTIQPLSLENLVTLMWRSKMISYNDIQVEIRSRLKRHTFISSTNEGNPPIDMKVTKPKTKDAHEPLAYSHRIDKPE